MKLRELKCAFFLILSLLTCLLMYLLLDTSVAVTASGWTHQRLYDFAALFDKEPIYIIIFLGVIALAETVAGLLYLLTPVEQRMIKYKQGEDEVLVNLDTLAASLQRTVEGEPDVDYIKVQLRVPPGKQLHIHCFIRLGLVEQPDVPSRVDRIRERLRTYFVQSLPLEAKFTTSIELKIVPAKMDISNNSDPKEPLVENYSSGEFQGPVYPIDE